MTNIIKDCSAPIDWNIGSLFYNETILKCILDICDFYNVNHNIRYVFGSIPSLMAGGRIDGLRGRKAETSVGLRILCRKGHKKACVFRLSAFQVGWTAFFRQWISIHDNSICIQYGTVSIPAADNVLEMQKTGAPRRPFHLSRLNVAMHWRLNQFLKMLFQRAGQRFLWQSIRFL